MSVVCGRALANRLPTDYAPDVWKVLNGVFCVYKPKDMTMGRMKYNIAFNLCRDLNNLKVRPPSNYVKIEGSGPDCSTLIVTNVPNLADTPQVVGPRYQEKDIKLKCIPEMSERASGVCLVGINKGCIDLLKLKKKHLLSKYEASGTFGKATTTSFEESKVFERSTYDHIRSINIDRILAAWQANHQQQMFNLAGVDIQSQEAYELACKGLIRPTDDSSVVIYHLKCTELNLPDFRIDILSINENQDFFADIIHELGWRLKSTAFCRQIRLVQYGNFTLKLALLRKHWTVQNIIDSIALCAPLVSETLHTESPNL